MPVLIWTKTFEVKSSNHSLSPPIGSQVTFDRQGWGEFLVRICDPSGQELKQVTAKRNWPQSGSSKKISGVWAPGVKFTLSIYGQENAKLTCNFKDEDRGSDAWTADEDGP